jgi:hypothetical protein
MWRRHRGSRRLVETPSGEKYKYSFAGHRIAVYTPPTQTENGHTISTASTASCWTYILRNGCWAIPLTPK